MQVGHEQRTTQHMYANSSYTACGNRANMECSTGKVGPDTIEEHLSTSTINKLSQDNCDLFASKYPSKIEMLSDPGAVVCGTWKPPQRISRNEPKRYIQLRIAGTAINAPNYGHTSQNANVQLFLVCIHNRLHTSAGGRKQIQCFFP